MSHPTNGNDRSRFTSLAGRRSTKRSRHQHDATLVAANEAISAKRRHRERVRTNHDARVQAREEAAVRRASCTPELLRRPTKATSYLACCLTLLPAFVLWQLDPASAFSTFAVGLGTNLVAALVGVHTAWGLVELAPAVTQSPGQRMVLLATLPFALIAGAIGVLITMRYGVSLEFSLPAGMLVGGAVTGLVWLLTLPLFNYINRASENARLALEANQHEALARVTEQYEYELLHETGAALLGTDDLVAGELRRFGLRREEERAS